MKGRISNTSFITMIDEGKKDAFINEGGLPTDSSIPRILIIEENLVLQEMLACMLILAGYHAVTTDTHLIDSFNEQPVWSSNAPDLILLDLGISQESSIHQLQQVRTRWKHSPPIIVLTASRTLYNEFLGIERMVLKPFHLSELMIEIEQALAGA